MWEAEQRQAAAQEMAALDQQAKEETARQAQEVEVRPVLGMLCVCQSHMQT